MTRSRMDTGSFSMLAAGSALLLLLKASWSSGGDGEGDDAGVLR